MSTHYLHIRCARCRKTETLYTGSIETYEFDDGDWEMETIEVGKCIECKQISA